MFGLLVTANVFPSSPILVTLMIEATLSSETPVLTKVTGRHISEDGILRKRLIMKDHLSVFGLMLNELLFILIGASTTARALLPRARGLRDIFNR
jgi:hypothetical protein